MSSQRQDYGKHSILCLACGEDRPVDIQQWTEIEPCSNCGEKSETTLMQMGKYKELHKLLTMKGEKMTETSRDSLLTWCAGQMEGVFGQM